MLLGASPGAVSAGAPVVEGAAAARVVQPLGPCLLPHPDTASYVAVFESQGWTRVTEGPLFDRAVLASGEILLAGRVMPPAFDTAQEAERYFDAARNEGRRQVGLGDSALLVKGDMNVLIQSGLARGRLSVGCYLAAPRLAEVDQSGPDEPTSFGERVLAVGMSQVKVPPTPGIERARSSLLRLFVPQQLRADSAGNDGIWLLVRFEPGVTGNRIEPAGGTAPVSGDTGVETAAAPPPDPDTSTPVPAAGTAAIGARALARLVTVTCSLPGYSLEQRIGAFKDWHEAKPAQMAAFSDIFADGVQAIEIVEHGTDPAKATEIRSRVGLIILQRFAAPLDDIGKAPTRLLVSDADPGLALIIGENGTAGNSTVTCSFLIDAPARERVDGLAGLFMLSTPLKSTEAEIRRMNDSIRSDDWQLNYLRRLIVLGPATAPRAAILFASMMSIQR